MLQGAKRVRRSTRCGDAHDRVASVDATRVEIASSGGAVVLGGFHRAMARVVPACDDRLHEVARHSEGRRALRRVKHAEPA